MSNIAISGNAAKEALASVLPGSWAVRFENAPRAGLDGLLEVKSPSGRLTRFVLEIKSRFEPRDIHQIQDVAGRTPLGAQLLLFTRHLSRRSRDLLCRAGISHADISGNVWLSADSLFVDRTGTVEAPVLMGDAHFRTTLRGPITARIIRYLCDTPTPLKVRQIATASTAHPGNVSRLLGFLDQERFIERDSKGTVTTVYWAELIKRWSADLQLLHHAQSFLEPRGLPVVTAKLARSPNLLYAVTGAFASAEIVQVVEPVAVDIYVDSIADMQRDLSIKPTDRLGNVRLLQAFDRVVFEHTRECNGIVLCSPSQIAADLFNLPSRSSDEVSELLDWMKRHESDWRY